MAQTPEGKVKEKVKAILKRRGVWYCMPRGQTYGRAGIPDFLCCHKGRFIAIETKAGRGKATPLQMRELKDLFRHQGIVLIVREDGMDELEYALDFAEQVGGPFGFTTDEEIGGSLDEEAERQSGS